jgi:succinyl-diaminopimelate desuccinylase
VESHPELFGEGDFVLVPDGGNEEGTFIETAEKNILWLKVKVEGRQVHASMPQKGMNAHRIALEYAHRLDKLLHEKYAASDDLFEPPRSTFEPTMVSNPSGSPNIVPGEHELVFDCRILPGFTTEEILDDAQDLADQVREEFAEGDLPRFSFETPQRLDAPEPTDPESPIVKALKQAILDLRGKGASVGGIGGGTFAAFFRKRGIPAVVWASLDEMAHQADEYARIDNLVEDAKVMASLPLFYL